jgi:hypothetical protein
MKEYYKPDGKGTEWSSAWINAFIHDPSPFPSKIESNSYHNNFCGSIDKAELTVVLLELIRECIKKL